METSSNIEEEPNIFLGDSACTICHGLGYIKQDVPVHHPNFGRMFPCSCRVPELQKKNQQALWNMSNLQGFGRYTFDTFHPNRPGISVEQHNSLQRIYEVVQSYAKKPEGWLLLQGGYGCGKTHLAAAIANYNVKRGIPVLFITVPDLLDYLRAAFNPNSTEPYSERFRQVRDAPLLILDDLGTENATSWAMEKLFQIFNHRYMLHLPTVITTNRDIEGLEPRLRSRISDSALVKSLAIRVRDYRRKDKEAETNLNTLIFYADMGFDNFDFRPKLSREPAKNLQRAHDAAREYAEAPNKKWLVLTGPYGSGKTYLAAAIANTWSQQGYTVLFVIVPDLLDYLRAAYNPQSLIPYDKRFEEVRTAPFLVLDDLGTESATPWAKEKIYQLFNYRYIARLPTIITTARKIGELDPKLSTRLLDKKVCRTFAITVPAYYEDFTKSTPNTARPRGKTRALRR